MPDSGTATIPEADPAHRIPGSRQPDGPGTPRPADRHRDAVSAYADACCADRRAGRELADEAWQRAGGADGHPAPSRLHLLAEVTRTAAEWADSGRGSALSPAFTAWLADLPRPGGGVGSARAALSAAEADSLVLSAFGSLPAARQQDLWRRLDDAAGSQAGSPARPPRAENPVERRLQDACLRAYASRTPQRSCRHLAARLADRVRHTAAGDPGDLDRHLAKCASCRSVRADLEAIRTWQRPALLRALVLWDAEASAPASPSAVALGAGQQPRESRPPTPAGPSSDGPRPGAHDPGAPTGRRRLPRAKRADGRAGWHLLIPVAAAGAGGLAALAVAGLLLTTVERAGEHPQPVDAPTLPAPGTPSPTTDSDDAPPEIGPAAMSSPTPTPATSATAPTGASPTPTPSATRSATAPPTSAAPSPTPPVAAGIPLVNYGSGLCVGLAPAAQTAGPPQLQLQQCGGQATQRWQRLPVGQDTYQLRNTGTGTCLDGTTTGGNLVAVTLTVCRSDPGHPEQLWRFTPNAQATAFRLGFVPPVPASDYSAHLLGPQDWTDTTPPHPGSLLVHLPNYYQSESFLFTMG
ncbi:RICIN domain-containing protein [Kitasatospora sp. NPDC086791]|uniref:RICIN domain-containing protein n=1 Tax=Kitasatospora sp. NPDC086791 TaxID=3155178 RepID=UPI003416773E